MDGKIVIGTELDTEELEKKLKEEEKLLKKYEKEAEKLTETKAKIEIEAELKSQNIENKIKEIQEKARIDVKGVGGGSGDYYSRKAKEEKINEMAQLKVNQLTEEWERYLIDVDDEIESINSKLKQNAVNQELVNKSISKTSIDLDKANQEEEEFEYNSGKAGKSFSKLIGKASKLALAIFGIRSAYMFVRRAMDTITQSDAQLKADIDYMKNALAYTLEPLIRQIVGWAQKLMQYIQYIIYKWTGKNIFANANKSLKSATGQAKELKKQLMGFDEVNMLQDTSSGGGGAGTPSFDLSKVMDEDAMPKWVKWIAENKKLIEDLAITALGIFGTLTIANWIKNIAGFLGSSQLGELGTSLMNLGLIAGGIIITTICAQKVWQEIQEMKTELGWIADHIEENTKKWLDTEPAVDTLYDTLQVRQNATNDLMKTYHSWWYKILGLDEDIVKNLVAGVKGEKQIVDEAMERYDVEKATNDEKDKMIKMIEEQIKKNNEVRDILKEQGKSTKEIDDMNKELSGYLYSVRNNIKYDADATKDWWIETGKVKTSYDGVVELLDKIDDKDLKDKQVKVKSDTTDYDKSVNNIKNSKPEAKVKVKADTNGFMDSITTAIRTAFNNLSFPGKSTATKIASLFGIKLAKGGIINMPGRGVPLGLNVIGGEAGREGVVPLTDATAMAQLGEEIGKWVNIAIDNRMVVDGRVLATATNNQINKDNFLMNR